MCGVAYRGARLAFPRIVYLEYILLDKIVYPKYTKLEKRACSRLRFAS